MLVTERLFTILNTTCISIFTEFFKELLLQPFFCQQITWLGSKTINMETLIIISILTETNYEIGEKGEKRGFDYSSYIDEENGFISDSKIVIFTPSNPSNTIHGEIIHFAFIFLFYLSILLSFPLLSITVPGFCFARGCFSNFTSIFYLGNWLRVRRWRNFNLWILQCAIAGLLLRIIFFLSLRAMGFFSFLLRVFAFFSFLFYWVWVGRHCFSSLAF